MGSSVSSLFENLSKDVLGDTILENKLHLTSLWPSYVVDDIHMREYEIEVFTNHIGNFDADTKFTIEPDQDNKLP